MAEIVKVKKSEAELIMEFTKNSIFSNFKYEDGFYIVSEADFEIIKREFKIAIRIEAKRINYDDDSINFDTLKALRSEYLRKSTLKTSNEFNHIEGENITDEELYEIALKVAKEITTVEKIPSLRREIKELIREVELNNLSYEIETIKTEFDELLLNGGTYEQYFSIKKRLESIIRKTYFDNVSNIISGSFNGTYLIKEDEQVYLIDKTNAIMFSYGLIYSPKSILKASNGGDNVMVPFNKLNRSDYNIEMGKNEKPIGVYAVTLGEKDLNENYVRAQSLLKTTGSNYFLDIDLSKILEGEDFKLLKNDFIKRMLVNSNRITEEQVKASYYEDLSIFFDRFMELKQQNYEQGNVINLFEEYCRIVYGQCYSDPSVVLRTKKVIKTIGTDKDEVEEEKLVLGLEKVKDIFEYSIHYDFNIYKRISKNEDVTNNDVALFVGKFYKYRNNRYLNLIYPGIGSLLDYLITIEGDEYDKVCEYINTYKPDPWQLSQRFNPTHKSGEEETQRER